MSRVNVEQGHKLTVSEQMKVLALIAGGYNASRIVDYLKDHCDKEVSRQNIQENYINNKEYAGRIKSIRNIIDKNLAAHPLASKTIRLNYLLEGLNEATTWRLDKLYHDKESGEILDKIEKKNIGVIPHLIREARTEIEGEDSKDGSSIEEILIELIRKADQELTDVKGFRIIRKEHRILDRYLSRGS